MRVVTVGRIYRLRDAGRFRLDEAAVVQSLPVLLELVGVVSRLTRQAIRPRLICRARRVLWWLTATLPAGACAKRVRRDHNVALSWHPISSARSDTSDSIAADVQLPLH